jgi:hypothetical protein
MWPPWCSFPARKDDGAARFTEGEMLKGLAHQLVWRVDPIVLECSLWAPGPVTPVRPDASFFHLFQLFFSSFF